MFHVEHSGDTLTRALERFSAEGNHRFHLPGHKGVLPPPLDGAARIDMTELRRTGNLYTEADGLIRRAERRCAALYGASSAQFLTGGSTQGILAMLGAVTRPGDTVAVDRGCHRSVYAAMALLDLTPRYLTRERLEPCGVGAALEPSPLPEETVCMVLTCPTYYGVRSPNRDWRTASGRPVPVLVDAAHGAHLPFLSHGAASPLDGAHMAVCSAHKTLPALGQAAFLLLSEAADAERLRDMTALFGTASPSYVILASMDGAFAALEQGRDPWAETAAYAAALRADYPSLLAETPDLALDAARLCLHTGDGFRDALRLEREWGILSEMADNENVVLILSSSDPPESRAALRRALEGLALGRGILPYTGRLPPLPLPQPALRLRDALFAPAERVRLADAAGRAAARPLAPYPPGIPLVAPGEIIDKNHIEILCGLCYNERLRRRARNGAIHLPCSCLTCYNEREQDFTVEVCGI